MAVRFLFAVAGMIVGAMLAPAGAAALELQPVGSFAEPMYVTSDPDDASRLFVVERGGQIQLKEGSSAPTGFLDIADRVSTDGERGLLSMALPPDFATSGRFYVFYTRLDGDLRISEFIATGDVADEGSEREVLTIEHSSASNHNGGQLQFGPDGLLYGSTGDGGGGGDPSENAQNTSSLLGKILRINPTQSGSDSYTIPAGNPFAGPTPGADEVWSYGLRNPWRFSFDRLTGSLLIGDVGQGAWEEVDFDPVPTGAGRGDNFGWDCREGAHPYTGPPGAPSPACETAGTLTGPVFEYPNPPDGGAAITGGFVARDPALGDLRGRYLYADLFAGEIRSLCPGLPAATGDRSEGLHVDFPTSFGEDAAGRVYVASQLGPVSRLAGPVVPGACPRSPEPGPEPGPEPDTSPPNLDLDAKRRHDIDQSRKLKVRATVDESAEVELHAKIRLGGNPLRLGEEGGTVEPGESERLRWKLSRREKRRVKRRLHDGDKVKARVKGEATDATGNASEPSSLKIKLVR